MPTAILPHDLSEACRALRDHPDHVVVAGGTDVMVRINAGAPAPAGWISLRGVSELTEIEPAQIGERDTGGQHTAWRIGAGITFARLAREPRLGPLARAARVVGSPQIRSTATLGGNLVTASPAGDSLPALLCMDALVHLRTAAGGRVLPLAAFLLGPGHTACRDDEIVAAVTVTTAPAASAFVKVGPRSAMTIATCSLAARLDPAQGVARVAIGAAAPTALRIDAAEAHLLDRGASDAFAEAVADGARPIDDHRATAEYRLHALRTVARRVHQRLWAEVVA